MVSPGDVISIIQGAWEYFSGGDIAIKSDRVTTNEHKCNRETCPWRSKAVRVLTLEQRVVGIGWVRSRLELIARFEYNGCDVNNARITLGRRSFIGFLSGASYSATATGGASQIRGRSGCEQCCDASSCVEFDLVVYASGALTIGGGARPYTIRICGDGTVRRSP